MAAREFDLVIYGATGFTGLRTCQYLARTYKQGVRWAIAGRSAKKLEEVREKLVVINPALSKLAIIQADSSNVEELASMAARTKVVLSTVGPFMKYGEPLVGACVKQGTHYIDSTGESPFVNRIIKKYHEEAKAKNVVLVPQCGFDSVPSELGTRMVVEHLRKEHNVATKSVKLSVVKLRGSASGGTLASACEIIETREGGLSAMRDQNQLVPASVVSKVLPATISTPTVFWDKDIQQWQAYFVMSSSNEKIVKRSHGLLLEQNGVGYGPEFTYSESQSFPGFFSAVATSVSLSLGGVALAVGPLRRLIQNKFMPAPGTGPSDEEIAKSHFTIKVIGEGALPENVSGGEKVEPARAVAVIQGGDPGYGETCRYLVEGALCMVQNEDQVRAENKITGGVLTPAYAFGNVLVNRLRAQDCKLTVSKL
ncbi:hypothetical protein BGZ83_012194 [Gryganskiella cystojenkinii]|nr:hypothetical protein BGZ83_012194 [Gryganskiella cystojenkinii]